eukprot:892696-Pelagomonas_calceolata.AAC.11
MQLHSAQQGQPPQCSFPRSERHALLSSRPVPSLRCSPQFVHGIGAQLWFSMARGLRCLATPLLNFPTPAAGVACTHHIVHGVEGRSCGSAWAKGPKCLCITSCHLALRQACTAQIQIVHGVKSATCGPAWQRGTWPALCYPYAMLHMLSLPMLTILPPIKLTLTT